MLNRQDAIRIAACTISNEQTELNEDDDRIVPNVQKQHEMRHIKTTTKIVEIHGGTHMRATFAASRLYI